MSTVTGVGDDEPQLRPALPIATGRRAAAKLWHQVLRFRRLAWAALLLTVLAASAGVVVPLLLGDVVDIVLDGDGTRLGLLVVLLVVAALASGVLTAVSRRYSDQLGMTMAADLREQVIDKALRMDSATLERAGTGDVTSRVTEDVELVNTSVRVAAGVFTSLVTVVLTFVGFATLDWRLALAFLLVFPVHAFGLRRFLPAAGPLYAKERVAAGERTQQVMNVLHGAPTVHAYGMEARQTAVVERASRRAVDAALTAIRAFFRFASTMNIAEAVGLVAVLTTGFLLVRADQVSVGDVTAAALLFHRLFGPLGTLLMSFNDIQSAGAALTRLVGVADLPVPRDGVPRDRPTSADLVAHGVSHTYVEGEPVLHGVDVRVPAGQSLAVVGESGAGKTTLAAILGGVFPATDGVVTIGGVEVTELDPVQLRQRVGVVTQEVHVFSGSFRDDLLLVRPDAGDDDLHAALTVVGADRWVVALPDGLDTVVGEGHHKLTAAQAQQVALARIVLADPPVVILDEATAEAGSAGARELELSARAALAGRTAVVVAHRLTQAQECDEVAVMADGRIVEQGTPAELVAAGGAYATLWRAWHAS